MAARTVTAWVILVVMEGIMFAILRGANGRRHEVDFNEDPVIVDVAMSSTTVQITMTAAGSGDLSRSRYITVALPRDALASAMAAAAAAARQGLNAEPELRLVENE
jgi:hypothetical protein